MIPRDVSKSAFARLVAPSILALCMGQGALADAAETSADAAPGRDLPESVAAFDGCARIGNTLDQAAVIAAVSGRTHSGPATDGGIWQDRYSVIGGPDETGRLDHESGGNSHSNEYFVRENMVCFPAGEWCMRMAPCLSGEAALVAWDARYADPFVIETVGSGEGAAPIEVSAPSETFLSPVGNGPIQTLTSSGGPAAGCAIRTTMPDVDDFTWTGACDDGVVAGPGKIEFFRNGMLREMFRVGAPREVGLRDGLLLWRDVLPKKVIMTELVGGFGGQRKANVDFVVPDTFNVHSTTTLNWLLSEAIHRIRQQGFQCNTAASIGNVCYNVVITSDPARVAEMRRSNGSIGDYPAIYAWASLTPSLKISAMGRTPRMGYGVAHAGFAEDLIARNKQTRDAQWAARMDAILADPERRIDNIADLIRFDERRTIAALAGGRQIDIAIDEVAFRDGSAILTDRHVPSDIYEGVVPEALVAQDAGWSGFLDAARQSGSMAQVSGIVVSCSMDVTEMPESGAAEDRVFDAVLQTYNSGRMQLACTPSR